MSEHSPQATGPTAQKVEAWIHHKRRVADCERRLNEAKAELRTATNDLGRYLVPNDLSANERFNIWFGNGILCAQMKEDLGDGSGFDVWWRKEPTGKQAVEQGV